MGGEFKRSLADPRILDFFLALEVDVTEARRLFEMLDMEGDGKVLVEEFVDGCLKYNGAAKNIDIHCLIAENRGQLQRADSIFHLLEQQFDRFAGPPVGSEVVCGSALTDSSDEGSVTNI